jgi:hypothetical protein
MPLDARVTPHRALVVEHLARAGRALELHQVEAQGPTCGNVSPWESQEAEDFHGTLMAIWIWARHQALSGQKRFEESRTLAWRYVLESGVRHLPEVLTPADYEAPFDCACLLRAALADREAGSEESRQAMADLAAESLRAYLEGGFQPGREFRDPGFLVWSLGEYARAAHDDVALRAAGVWADRHFGTKVPPAPADEPSSELGMFDFLSTSSTRVLAGIATQGETPFVGAWLRERVLPAMPTAFVARPRDENSWNASVAWLLGLSYTLTHDVRFLEPYLAVIGELTTRDGDGDGAIGRDPSFPEAETLPTWAWAVAMDSLQAR